METGAVVASRFYKELTDIQVQSMCACTGISKVHSILLLYGLQLVVEKQNLWQSSSRKPRSYLIRTGDGLHVHHCCVSIGLESQAYFMLDGSSHCSVYLLA